MHIKNYVDRKYYEDESAQSPRGEWSIRRSFSNVMNLYTPKLELVSYISMLGSLEMELGDVVLEFFREDVTPCVKGYSG